MLGIRRMINRVRSVSRSTKSNQREIEKQKQQLLEIYCNHIFDFAEKNFMTALAHSSDCQRDSSRVTSASFTAWSSLRKESRISFFDSIILCKKVHYPREGESEGCSQVFVNTCGGSSENSFTRFAVSCLNDASGKISVTRFRRRASSAVSFLLKRRSSLACKRIYRCQETKKSRNQSIDTFVKPISLGNK